MNATETWGAPFSVCNRTAFPASEMVDVVHTSATFAISAYAACHSRKFDVRCSPELRRNRSTSGMSGT